MIVAVLVLLVSLGLTRWLVRPNALIRIIDRPNERSLHETPTPRTGGIAICAALLTGVLVSLLLPNGESVPMQVIAGAAIVAAVSIVDDTIGLSPALRLLMQVGAASVLVANDFIIEGEILPGLIPGSGAVLVAGTVLATVWLTNLYNFMDGMDGFAGGMTVIGFGAMALLAWTQGDAFFAGSALVVCAAAGGFLFLNFPPARIFMGDSGSTTLGFLAAGFAIWGSRRGVAPVWTTLVIFSPFVVDATVTLVRRALRGEPVWRAHRSHYYQRLVKLGWGHRRTVLVEYAAMLACVAAAIATVHIGTEAQWFILAALAVAYMAAASGVHRLEQSDNATKTS